MQNKSTPQNNQAGSSKQASMAKRTSLESKNVIDRTPETIGQSPASKSKDISATSHHNTGSYPRSRAQRAQQNFKQSSFVTPDKNAHNWQKEQEKTPTPSIPITDLNNLSLSKSKRKSALNMHMNTVTNGGSAAVQKSAGRVIKTSQIKIVGSEKKPQESATCIESLTMGLSLEMKAVGGSNTGQGQEVSGGYSTTQNSETTGAGGSTTVATYSNNLFGMKTSDCMPQICFSKGGQSATKKVPGIMQTQNSFPSRMSASPHHSAQHELASNTDASYYAEESSIYQIRRQSTSKTTYSALIGATNTKPVNNAIGQRSASNKKIKIGKKRHGSCNSKEGQNHSLLPKAAADEDLAFYEASSVQKLPPMDKAQLSKSSRKGSVSSCTNKGPNGNQQTPPVRGSVPVGGVRGAFRRGTLLGASGPGTGTGTAESNKLDSLSSMKQGSGCGSVKLQEQGDTDFPVKATLLREAICSPWIGDSKRKTPFISNNTDDQQAAEITFKSSQNCEGSSSLPQVKKEHSPETIKQLSCQQQASAYLSAARSITKSKRQSIAGGQINIRTTTFSKSRISVNKLQDSQDEAFFKTNNNLQLSSKKQRQNCNFFDTEKTSFNGPVVQQYASTFASPKATTTNGNEVSANQRRKKSIGASQITPNPLIKNSFVSPNPKEMKGCQQLDYSDTKVPFTISKPNSFSFSKATEISLKKKGGEPISLIETSVEKSRLRGGERSKSKGVNNGGNGGNNHVRNGSVGSDRVMKNMAPWISDCQNMPTIKGIKKQLMSGLYAAKTQDLKINPSKQQMGRFFDKVAKNHEIQDTRKLNLQGLDLGDSSAGIVSKILKQNCQFAQVDLSSNFITNAGLKSLTNLFQNQQATSVVHLNLGGNAISAEGSVLLFKSLAMNQSLTSLNLGNKDCYKQKVKIGGKGAEELRNLLQSPTCVLSHLDVSDNALTPEALNVMIKGAKHCRSLISLNLAQNDIGTANSAFSRLMQLFQAETSNLLELSLENNQLQDRHLEEMAEVLEKKQCGRMQLSYLNLSSNKFRPKGLASLLITLSKNTNAPISRLILNNNDLCVNKDGSQLGVFYFFTRALLAILSASKHLQNLSLSNCSLSKECLTAIGEGLGANQGKLQTLNLSKNRIQHAGIKEIAKSCAKNVHLRLKNLDLSNNQLDDEAGQLLAKSLKELASIENLNLRSNTFGENSGDMLLFLASENRSIIKLNMELNLVKPQTIQDLDKILKQNKIEKEKKDLPSIKKEIKGLKKNMGKQGPKDIGLLERAFKSGKKEIRQNLDKIGECENQIEQVRVEAKTDYQKIVDEQKQVKATLDSLEKKLAVQDEEHKAIRRGWERKIDETHDLIEENHLKQSQIVNEMFSLTKKGRPTSSDGENKSISSDDSEEDLPTNPHTTSDFSKPWLLTVHEIINEKKRLQQNSKQAKDLFARMTNQLQQIEKKNETLKLIETQYRREIGRRERQAEREQIEQETGVKIESSPKRRARQCVESIYESPSPIRRMMTSAKKEFKISPEKTQMIQLTDNKKQARFRGGLSPSSPRLLSRNLADPNKSEAKGKNASNNLFTFQPCDEQKTPDKNNTSSAAFNNKKGLHLQTSTKKQPKNHHPLNSVVKHVEQLSSIREKEGEGVSKFGLLTSKNVNLKKAIV